MKNNKCFIIGSMKERRWKNRMHNMELHVESTAFFSHCGDIDIKEGRYKASSPRTVLKGTEGKLKRWFKLRKAVLSCSTVYVLKNYIDDEEAFNLFSFACKTHRDIIMEEEDE